MVLLTVKPAAFLAVLLLAGGLGLAWWNARGLQLGLDLISNMPLSSESGSAAQAASRGFAPGILAPTLVLLHQPGIASSRAGLVQLEAAIARQPGVAGVLGPREEYLVQAAGGQVGQQAAGDFVSQDGDYARYLVVLGHAPYSAPAIANVNHLSRRLPGLLAQSGLKGAAFGVGGDSAFSGETIDLALADILRVAIAVVVVDYLILAIFLRSLLAPIYLVGASLLALGAPLAITIAIFQRGLGAADLSFIVPVAAGVLLVALGSDYNLFVVGRVAEEARLRPLNEAVVVAVPLARRAITVAAITLSFSFAMLAIVPVSSARELAAALFFGILIDSFLVRSYLVPALIGLFGRIGRRPSPD
jgi:RND superfamily putative drug exporter